MPSRLKSSLLDLDDVAPDESELTPINGKTKSNSHSKSNGGHSSADEQDSDESEGEDSDEVDARRDHYEEVGPSSRRRKANLTEDHAGTLDQGKYRGQTATWSEMNGNDDEQDSSEEEEDDVDDDDGESIDSESDSEDDQESERETPPPSKKSRRSVRFDETALPQDAPGPHTLFSSLSNQSQLLSTMKDQAKEDARRGKAIKEQMTFWQKSLENRIKLEKILGGRGIGRVQPSAMSQLVASTSAPGQPSPAWALASTLLDHSAALLETQAQLLLHDNDETLEMDDELQTQFEQTIARPKRKRDTDITDYNSIKKQHLEQVTTTLEFGNQILQRFSSSTLNSHAVRGGSRASKAEEDRNKFSTGGLKAFDQSITKQIETAMSGDSGLRLLDRTKKYRGQTKRIGSQIHTGDGTQDDRETFDDSDFYSSLLRSLIESSSMSSSTDAGIDGSNTPMAFHPRTNTKVRGVDTRASKGRKLRYEIIEKVANFMPKIANREKWTDEMKERLYAILPGGGSAGDEESEDEDEDQDAQPEESLGELRLFG